MATCLFLQDSRKIHYENKPIRMLHIFFQLQKSHFSVETVIFFPILAPKHFAPKHRFWVLVSLTARGGGFNECAQSMLLGKIKKNRYTPVHPGFSIYEPSRGKTNNVVSDIVQAQKRARSSKFRI